MRLGEPLNFNAIQNIIKWHEEAAVCKGGGQYGPLTGQYRTFLNFCTSMGYDFPKACDVLHGINIKKNRPALWGFGELGLVL